MHMVSTPSCSTIYHVPLDQSPRLESGCDPLNLLADLIQFEAALPPPSRDGIARPARRPSVRQPRLAAVTGVTGKQRDGERP